VVNYETDLLRLLFQERKLSYRNISRKLDNLHLQTTRRELNKLMKKRFVREDGRKTWERGQLLFYSLTKKGRAAYIHQAFDTANNALKEIREISDVILSDPEKLAEWKKMSREYFDTTKTSQEKYKIYEPLHESYKNLHVIIHLLSLPPILHNVPMFIGMDKGSLCLIPNQVLEDTGLLGPVTLRLKPSMFNQEHRHPAES
jgi:hypothetical protein